MNTSATAASIGLLPPGPKQTRVAGVRSWLVSRRAFFKGVGVISTSRTSLKSEGNRGRRARLTDEEVFIRLIGRIDSTHPIDKCWPYVAAKSPSGYGSVRHLGRMRPAHRVLYELINGEVPPGYEVDHVAARGCVTRTCCNIFHLEAVTHRENMRRASHRVGRWKLSLTSCPNGHEYTEETTGTYRGWRFCKRCVRERAKQRWQEKLRRRAASSGAAQ